MNGDGRTGSTNSREWSVIHSNYNSYVIGDKYDSIKLMI